MGRKIIIHAVSAIVLLATATHRLQAEIPSENQARFGEVIGDVGLLTQGALEWIVPHEGLPIESGDQIRTGEEGKVELILSENAMWTLESETQVAMERTDANSGRLTLSSGTLLGRVDSAKAAGVSQRWEFNTPMAVIAVRGTEFAIEAIPSMATRLGVFEGEVDMQPAETAEGLPPPIRIAAGNEGLLWRGKTALRQVLGERMRGIDRIGRPRLRERHRRIQQTWSPYTPLVRGDLRKRFVAPPPKAINRKPVRREPRRGIRRQGGPPR